MLSICDRMQNIVVWTEAGQFVFKYSVQGINKLGGINSFKTFKQIAKGHWSGRGWVLQGLNVLANGCQEMMLQEVRIDVKY